MKLKQSPVGQTELAQQLHTVRGISQPKRSVSMPKNGRLVDEVISDRPQHGPARQGRIFIQGLEHRAASIEVEHGGKANNRHWKDDSKSENDESPPVHLAEVAQTEKTEKRAHKSHHGE